MYRKQWLALLNDCKSGKLDAKIYTIDNGENMMDLIAELPEDMEIVVEKLSQELWKIDLTNTVKH